MNNIDWRAFETKMSLMLINMKLESLPTDLEKLVDKSYELADNAEKDLNQNHRLSRWFALRVQPFVTGQRYSALNRLPCAPLFLAAAKAAYF
ncbi:MAG: hypothetical protein KIG83_03485 [Treponema sp.]|nr:hypothetical protein [Treponema sp.]